MAKRSKGNSAQFTYDFGISIAQSTVNKVTKLTGATLTLASAFYALKNTANEYVGTLKENTLRFGGMLATMKAMEQAQNRLIKGQSYFGVDDQLKGMNQLMAVGVNVGENLEWINKAAHATGKSFSEFSGMIASAIQGNAQTLVDAGLMTQRATRIFDKYAANTVMRQQAILSFVKNHKGLMNAIKNDFETIQGQMRRIKEVWKGFLQSIVGNPKDPQSFYGQIVSATEMVANALSRNFEQIKRYGYVIGQVLGWFVKQIGHFTVWVGRQAKTAIESVWKVTDDFQNQARSLIVWLEFWKLKVIDFFKAYGDEIKLVLELLVAYKALKWVFIIGDEAIASVLAYKRALTGMIALQKKYIAFMGPLLGNGFTRWLQSLAVFMPRWLRRIWVSVGKFFERTIFGGGFSRFMGRIWKGLTALFATLTGGAKTFSGVLKNIPAIFSAIFKGGKALLNIFKVSNPIGWIMLIISLVTALYKKWTAFRTHINNSIKFTIESLKATWNALMYIFTWIMVGCKKAGGWFKTYIWEPVANFFKSIWTWIGDMWDRFKDSSVGRWINKWIVTPIKTLFEWIIDAVEWVLNSLGTVVEWLSKATGWFDVSTKDLAKKYDVPELPTFSAGEYDVKDDTNYLKPSNWGIFQPNEEAAPVSNPILSTSGGGSMESFGGSGGSSSTNMTFNDGAIQIVVQNGEGIDEHVLAQKIKTILNDMKREGDMRGGMV